MNRDPLRETRRIPLNFRLGDISLFTLDLTLDVHLYTLAELINGGDRFPEIKPSHAGQALLSCPADAIAPGIERINGVIRYVPYTYERFYVDMRGSFDRYLEKFSSKSRNSSKRKVRKFAEACGGTIDFREYKTAESIAEFHSMARGLSARTYQERLLQAGLPSSQEFIEQMQVEAEQGRMRAYLVVHEGKAISYLYCPLHNDTAVYRHLGYDPEHARLSPGFVLQWLVLERLFEDEAVQFFDFTQGEGEQKQFFATSSIRCADVYLLKDNFKARAVVQGHAWLDSISSGLGNALDALGLKAHIKRLLRGT